jgi:hypothetical protein
VISGLSGAVARDDVTIEVNLVRLEHERAWSLEVVDDTGTSIVLDDLLPGTKLLAVSFSAPSPRKECGRFSIKEI